MYRFVDNIGSGANIDIWYNVTVLELRLTCTKIHIGKYVDLSRNYLYQTYLAMFGKHNYHSVYLQLITYGMIITNITALLRTTSTSWDGQNRSQDNVETMSWKSSRCVYKTSLEFSGLISRHHESLPMLQFAKKKHAKNHLRHRTRQVVWPLRSRWACCWPPLGFCSLAADHWWPALGHLPAELHIWENVVVF